jgi:hypothetical protein
MAAAVDGDEVNDLVVVDCIARPSPSYGSDVLL